MAIATILMAIVSIVLFVIINIRGEADQQAGLLKDAGLSLLENLPLLIFGFIAAEAIQYVIPTEAVSNWIGSKSGLRGLFIGTVMGSLMPTCPIVSVMMTANFLHAGASVGTAVAFMTAAVLLTVTRIPLEVGLIGWEFSAIRLASSLLFPVIAGLIANLLFSRVKLHIES